jgi:hypothetical protein
MESLPPAIPEVHVRAVNGTSPLLLIMALGFLAVPATAADGPQPDESTAISTLLAELDASDLQTRLAATRAILDRADLSLEDIERLIQTSRLSPEQHRRLVSVAWRRFKAQPKAAMGVRTDFVVQRGGVILQSATAGFHSAELLRRGDRLESADGHRLDDFNSLRLVILSREPGYEMPVVVIRDGAILNFKIRLARYEQLNAPPLDDRTLSESFRNYRAREYYDYAGEDAVLESGIPPEVWNEASLLDADPDFITAGQSLDADPENVSVVPGGQARGGVHQGISSISSGRGLRNLDGHHPANRALLAEIQLFQQIRQDRAIELQTARLHLADRSLPEQRRRELRELVTRLESEIAVYDLQIRQRTAQLRNR